MNSETTDVVLRTLAQAPAPLTAAKLREQLTGPFKLKEDELTRLLEEAVAAGRAHRFAPAARGRAARYGTRPAEEFAQERMIALLTGRPHTRAELLKRAQTTLAGFDEKQRQQLLAQLVRAGRAQELPPFLGGRAKLYSARRAEPRDYLEAALKKIGERFGLSRAALLRAAGLMQATSETPTDLNEPTQPNAPSVQPASAEPQPSEPLEQTGDGDAGAALLARMLQIKMTAAQGALVPLNTLWRSLRQEGWSKTDFDRLVLRLADDYRVALQRHNFPASLSEAEREELVADSLGNYYVGIALR